MDAFLVQAYKIFDVGRIILMTRSFYILMIYFNLNRSNRSTDKKVIKIIDYIDLLQIFECSYGPI